MAARNSFNGLGVPYNAKTNFDNQMAAPGVNSKWSMGGLNTPSSNVMNGMNTQANASMGGMDLDFMKSGYGYQDMVNNPTGNSSGGPGGLDFNSLGNTPADSGGGMDFLGPDGWGSLALGGIQTGLGAYMGFKKLGAAKDQLNFQKESFNKNYEASKQTTNTQLADRQKRRYAENPDHYKSESEYMKTNGIK